jgi:SAM-dependent methyltransferase
LRRDWRNVDFPIETFLDIIYAEAFTALEILEWSGLLGNPDQRRFLEIGAGAGLFSLFLQRQGYSITALEPSAQGFEYSHDLCQRLQRLFATELRVLPVAAEDLDPKTHGCFDVIFSVNVVEHFQPLWPNLDGMARALSPRGSMVHTCPNYWVPYEPHFRLPLIPLAPAWTRFLLSNRVRQSGLWKSFNFVNYGSVRRYAARYRWKLKFRSSLLASALRRLDSDTAFSYRHRGLVRTFGRLFNRTGITGLLERLPDQLSTPMTFRLSTLEESP